MIFDWVYGLFSNDLAIDLGTATTLAFVKGRGIVANNHYAGYAPDTLRQLREILGQDSEAGGQKEKPRTRQADDPPMPLFEPH